MKTSLKQMIALTVLLVGTVAVLTGCVKIVVCNWPGHHHEDALIGSVDKGPEPVDSETNVVVIDPTGSSGTLTVPITSFGSGDTSGSFPSSQGWQKKYVTFYFLGPNVNPLPYPNTYPNPDNVNSVTISTCLLTNGPTLDTGIL